MSFTNTHTYVTHTHTHALTQIHNRAQALVFLTKQACFKCCIILGYMRVKKLMDHQPRHPMTTGSFCAAYSLPHSANHPSSSLSSLGRNLYCCCRIWASFFRASSSSRSFLSISSWAAMIWREREQLTENVPRAQPNATWIARCEAPSVQNVNSHGHTKTLQLTDVLTIYVYKKIKH